MTVSWILREKGRAVMSILPDTPLGVAVDKLAANKIGAVVVADEQHRIEGILSERDIVRILATMGADALSEPVRDHMTRSVMTCSESHTIDWVMAQMTQHRFRHMPVAENGRLAGIISIGDVVKHKLAMAEAEAEQMRTYLTA
jgi:CBS domain-containing protein